MILTLKKIFVKKIYPKLCYKYKKNNLYQIPKLKKIVISTNFNKSFHENEILQKTLILNYITITGVEPRLTQIKKSNAEFDVRKNFTTGVTSKITKKHMFYFLTYFIFFVLNELKEMQNLSIKNFDFCLNFNFGIKEYGLFNLIDYNPDIPNFGFNCNIVFSKKNNKGIIDILQILFLLMKKNLINKNKNEN